MLISDSPQDSYDLSTLNDAIDKILIQNGVSGKLSLEINNNINKILLKSRDFKSEVTYISAKTEQGDTIYGSPVIGSWGKFISKSIEKCDSNSISMSNTINPQAI